MSQQDPQQHPWWSQAREMLLGGVVGVGVESVFKWLEGLGVWLQIAISAAVGALVLGRLVVWLAKRAVAGVMDRPRLAAALSRLFSLLGYSAAGVGAAFAVYGLSLVPGLFTPDPCAPPTELRVVTAAENIPALSARAREYAGLNVLDGCASLRITVSEAPPLPSLIYGLNHRWERDDDRRDNEPYARLYGLQPDAWVATSRGEAQLVHDAAEDRELVRIRDSVGRDQLVLALPSQAARQLEDRLGSGEAPSLEQAWQEVAELGLRVARPFTETSTAALSAAAEMDHDRLVEREAAMAAAPLPSRTVTSLLCAFHAAHRQDVALFVPEHSVDDYNAGELQPDPDRAERDGCPVVAMHGNDELTAVRVSGLRPFDHPFVSLRWKGQHTTERLNLVEGFGRWLRHHPLFTGGPDGDSLEAGELKAIRDRLDGEIHPALHVRLLVDQSGSARGLLRRPAAEAVRGLGALLGPRDRLSVSGFAAGRQGGSAVPQPIAEGVDRDTLVSAAEALESAAFAGWDAPISQALAHAGDGRAAPVILLTDGRLFDNDGRASETIGAALEKASSVNGLYVLVVGDGSCQVTKLSGTSKRYLCQQVTAEVPQALGKAVLTTRGWD